MLIIKINFHSIHLPSHFKTILNPLACERVSSRQVSLKNNNSGEISTSKRRLGELKGSWWWTKGSSVSEDREKKFGEDIKSPGGLFIAHEPQPLPHSVSSLHRGCVVDKAASNESSPSVQSFLEEASRQYNRYLHRVSIFIHLINWMNFSQVTMSLFFFFFLILRIDRIFFIKKKCIYRILILIVFTWYLNIFGKINLFYNFFLQEL